MTDFGLVYIPDIYIDKRNWLIKLLTDSYIGENWTGRQSIYSKGYVPTVLLEISETFDQYRKN